MKKSFLNAISLAVIAAVIAIGCGDSGTQNKNPEVGEFVGMFMNKGDGNGDSVRYTLTVNVTPNNSGTVSREPNNTSYMAGSQVTITAKESSGYKFTGWSGASNDTAATITVTMDGNQTLTANFQQQGVTPPTPTPTTYAVMVLSDGTGYSSGGNYEAGVLVTIKAGTAPAGKRFKNWTTSNNSVTFANANNETTTFTMPKNAVTVTANFELIVYSITYDLNNGTESTVNPESYTIETADFTLNNPTRDGYTFTGWTGSNGMTAQTSVAITKGSIGNKNYTANWAAIPYTITYNLNGGKNHSSNPPSYTIESPAITLNQPTKGSERFVGWYDNVDLRGDAVTSITTGSIGNKTYWARWVSITITSFTDDRDGKAYNKVTIGSQTWMAENLNYEPQTGNSWCYENSPDSCAKYGRLYDWNTAVTVCPSGWHLPSRDEWRDLAKTAGGTGNAGTLGTAGRTLKSTSGWDNRYDGSSGNGTDDFGSSALPGGSRNLVGYIGGVGEAGNWWTATDNNSAINNDVIYRSIYNSVDNVQENYGGSKGYGHSVRCLEN